MHARGLHAERSERVGGATRLMTAWLHVHRLIRSVDVEDVDDAAWPEVKDVIRQAVDRRTRSSRERWWNLTRPASARDTAGPKSCAFAPAFVIERRVCRACRSVSETIVYKKPGA